MRCGIQFVARRVNNKLYMQRFFIILISLICCFVLHTVAQEKCQRPQRTPEQEASKRTEMMKRDLQLTPFQVDTVYKINLKYAHLRRMITTREAMMQSFEKLNAELKKVLTPQQFEQHIVFLRNRRMQRSMPIKTAVDSVLPVSK